jgi:glycosyltransferase involved in cell wall biosynthesis
MRKTQVVYLGVDHSRFFSTWEDEGYLYYNSRFQKLKNQELAIEVARRTGYNLILSGFVSKDNMNYYDYIKKEAEESSVKILRNLSDDVMVKLLQRCSIFLFPKFCLNEQAILVHVSHETA